MATIEIPQASGAERRLMKKAEVLELTGVCYATLWNWMRAERDAFPRGIVIGHKTQWWADEVETWIAARPRQRLLGDPDAPKTKRGRRKAAA
jgi:predicted DNA-binding transcriptional regulator AlpA